MHNPLLSVDTETVYGRTEYFSDGEALLLGRLRELFREEKSHASDAVDRQFGMTVLLYVVGKKVAEIGNCQRSQFADVEMSVDER